MDSAGLGAMFLALININLTLSKYNIDLKKEIRWLIYHQSTQVFSCI